jgi:hypothetical protein
MKTVKHLIAVTVTVLSVFAQGAHLYMAEDSKLFQSTSPDGLNELRLNVNKDGMVYSVLRRGKVVVEPTDIALKIEGRGWLDGKAAAQGRAALPLTTNA